MTAHDALHLHTLLTRMADQYKPFLNYNARRYECSYCHSMISNSKHTARPDLHGPGCVWIEAMAFLKKLATAPAEEPTP